MAESIVSKAKVIQELEQLKNWLGRKSDKDSVQHIIDRIDLIAGVDASPVVHAYWYGSEFDGYADGFPVYDTWGCSHCHEEVNSEGFPPSYDYCPYCGAKMDAKEE